MKRLLLTLILYALPASASTWYVRPDGGTRYTANRVSAGLSPGQCNGMADAAYSGDGGTNENCAFNDVRFLFQDGTYATTTSGFPSWGWIGAGGDTYIIRGAISTGATYRIGWNNVNTSYDSPTGQFWGLQGDPYDSGIPAPPSGTATQHTQILGGNYAACSAQTSRTQIHGGYATGVILNMTGVSYVDVQCLDITDFSNCGLGAQQSGCNKNIGSLTDFASGGILWYNTSTHDTLTNVRIHGMAHDGMDGPTGDGTVFKYLDLVGNAFSGWSADPATKPTDTTGVGSLLVQNFSIIASGCAEEYPIVDAMPYGDCTDDVNGGYGDGFGTATVAAQAPGWQVTFDQGIVAYNTQDGLDALHQTGPGSSTTITRVLAYGNMGEQLKNGGQSGITQNNVVFTNCYAMNSPIPGFPTGYNTHISDFCRAGNNGLLMSVGKGSTLKVDNNTVFSINNSVGWLVQCDPSAGACDSTSLVDWRNNIFIAVGNGNNGSPATYIYLDGTLNGVNPFTNTGSIFANNDTFDPIWGCPATALNETNALCVDPKLTDETTHLYGYGNLTPLSGSPVIGAGQAVAGITTDFNTVTRPTPPSIGAIELAGAPTPTPVPVVSLLLQGIRGLKGIRGFHP